MAEFQCSKLLKHQVATIWASLVYIMLDFDMICPYQNQNLISKLGIGC